MSIVLKEAISFTWSRNRAYLCALVEDLSRAQMVAQPVGGITMNHPAWIVSHLGVYAPIAAKLLRREAIEDPAEHEYGRKSKPINDAGAYLPKDELMSRFLADHDDAAAALERADEGVFGEPTPLERWRAVSPTVGAMVVMLMVKHESMHLGQLSAWRRAMGLPAVQM